MDPVLFILFVCALCFGKAEDGPLYKEKPPWLKLCRRNDPNLNKCMNEMFTQMFPQLAVGIPEVKILPFEPLHIDEISVSKGAGPITLTGSFLNMTVMGPSNASSTFTELDIHNKKMHSGIYLPLLDIRARYNLKGNILVLPIIGYGTCELKLYGVDTKVDSDLSFPTVQDREIFRIEHMNVNFSVGSMKVQLHNLFNGNKVLGQTMNAFVNQNSQEVINELSDSIGESLGEILKNLMNNVFSKIPTDLWLVEGDAENNEEKQS